MAEYRVYFLDHEAKILGRREIDEPNDAAALAYVARRYPHEHIELWLANRRVATLNGEALTPSMAV